MKSNTNILKISNNSIAIPFLVTGYSTTISAHVLRKFSLKNTCNTAVERSQADPFIFYKHYLQMTITTRISKKDS